MQSQESMDCIISTDGLSKQFGKHTAVNQINLQVMEGDVFGFLGPNGAGKTTTIRMLLGLIKPTAGHITLFGHIQAGHDASVLER